MLDYDLGTFVITISALALVVETVVVSGIRILFGGVNECI